MKEGVGCPCVSIQVFVHVVAQLGWLFQSLLLSLLVLGALSGGHSFQPLSTPSTSKLPEVEGH